MKRLHVSVHVPDLAAAVTFYSSLFGAPPSVAKPDYAKWSLDDPRVNFVIEPSGAASGLNHLGIEAEAEEELTDVLAAFARTGGETTAAQRTQCCYAVSDKAWLRDPAGIAWEGFHTVAAAESYGLGRPEDGPCCADRSEPRIGPCC